MNQTVSTKFCDMYVVNKFCQTFT